MSGSVDTATAHNILASMFGLRDGAASLESLAGYSAGTGWGGVCVDGGGGW